MIMSSVHCSILKISGGRCWMCVCVWIRKLDGKKRKNCKKAQLFGENTKQNIYAEPLVFNHCLTTYTAEIQARVLYGSCIVPVCLSNLMYTDSHSVCMLATFTESYC